MARSQELKVQEKKELVAKEEKTVPARYYVPNTDIFETEGGLTVVMEIPGGYHVNANHPLGKYAIPTTVKIEAPKGVIVGPIVFPRALVRKLKAVNNESLAVYEGRAIMRFNVTVPANYGDGWLNLKARVRYQSCNDDVCFPPKNQDIDFGISIVGANDRVQRANGWVFGGR